MALVLTREAEQSIMIGNNIEIIVLDFKKNKKGDLVRLAIKAPRSVEIHRKEIWLERTADKARQKRRPKRGDKSQEVVMSCHQERLKAMIEMYRPYVAQWLGEDPSSVGVPDIIEYIMGDCILVADDECLDEQNIIDEAVRRVERVRNLS